MFDGKAFGEEMVGLVKAYVDRTCAPLIAKNTQLAEANAALVARIAALEAREAPEPAEIDMDAINRTIAHTVAEAVAALPAPQDGKSVTLDDVAPMIADAITEAVAALPAPQDGKSVTVDDLTPLVRDMVAEAVAALPPAQDGIGVAGALKSADGHLVLTLSNGQLADIGRVDGTNGKPGETFTLDDFDIEPVDERTIKLCFERGSERHTFELEFPVPIYRGVWRDAETYQRGDMVTWAGSTWHCDAKTTAKPGEASGHWTLAVKAGRPGRDKS